MRRQTVFAVITWFLSALATVALLELGVRLVGNRPELHNHLLSELDLFHSAYPSAFHPTLGWIPSPGFRGTRNIWKTEVTILDDGVRANRRPDDPMVTSASMILAVGDSFTFGDQVSDHETWPAVLERLLNIPVVNAGVFGYGIDQIVLRAESMIEEYSPEWLIVGIIADDVRRSALSRRTNVAKPYFTVSEGYLVLHTDHIAPPAETGASRLLSPA